jgi:site-specific DNA-methyltransferase (adenine-specific)
VTPYYQDDLVTLYHGDCRELLPFEVNESLAPDDKAVIVTDPPWPMERELVQGNRRAGELLFEMFEQTGDIDPERVVVILGQSFDPRILSAVPTTLDFRTVLWLRYARKVPKGGHMWESDVGYVFGNPPTTKATHVTPDIMSPHEVVAWGTRRNGRKSRDRRHPCSRHPDHGNWLIANWTTEDEVVIDPFAGSGTFLAAAKLNQRRAIGIEIEEEYCKLCVDALKQDVLPFYQESSNDQTI